MQAAAFVSLAPYRLPQGRLVDPVQPAAAQKLDPRTARAAGVLPFASAKHTLYVAAIFPLSPEASECLAALGPGLRLFRADEDDLRAAQERVYRPGAAGKPTSFGAIAVAAGKASPDTLERALATQRKQGGRLGAILTAMGALTFRDVAEVLARQRRLTFVNLLDSRTPGTNDHLFDLMPESFWSTHSAVPVGRSGNTLIIAVEDPTDTRAAQQLEADLNLYVRVVVTARRDIRSALEGHYRGAYLDASRLALERQRPEDSAMRLWTRRQKAWLLAVALALIACLWWNALATLIVLSSFAQLVYTGLSIFKIWLFREPSERVLEIAFAPEELAAIDDAALPPYTVLVPLREEASVLPIVAKALSEIDYPKDRLDVKLLIDDDDLDTLQAAWAGKLPPFMEIVPVPAAPPLTKPKACNYGLQHARGEFVVIYDAEDIPETDQLKKAALAFAQLGPEVACIQAKLSYFNRNQNWLTRWFTAEYAVWFDLLLPALQENHFPIPLGGTSNHLRTDVLREVGAWDPFNVTEDADLGIRLHKAGYRTGIIDSTTFEEANSEFVNWVRQRSRWVKGYIQTWLIHMRHPIQLWRELGPRGFLGFQAILGGTPYTFVVNPFYWTLTTVWFLSSWALVPQLFPSWVYYLGMLNLVFGNFVFSYHNMVATARRGDWDIVPYTMLAPLYWGMMSLAALKAVMQLISRPSHWEKTQHGLAGQTVAAPVADDAASAGPASDLAPAGRAARGRSEGVS